MNTVTLRDKGEIERFLRQNVYLHIYGIGDLDDFFWPHTTWYGAKSGQTLQAVVLLYEAHSSASLMALAERVEPTAGLLRSAMHLLPGKLTAHLSPGLEACFAGTWDIEPLGEHRKMALRSLEPVRQHDCAGVERLTIADADELARFYEESLPRNWFDPRMLETGQCFGIRDSGRIVSASAIHVYSPKYKVAALGSIATHPSHRRKGYATKVTARACQSLSRNATHIGLNVKADNSPAMSCYQRLGFGAVASYGLFSLARRE